MSTQKSAKGERQDFDSLPAELQQDIIQRVLRCDDVESSAAALLLVSKAWSQMVQPDRCVLELYRLDAESSKFLVSASMLDAEVRGFQPEGPEHDDGQITTAFSEWKRLRCLQLRRLRDLTCLASLRASSLQALKLEGLTFDLDDVAALGAALHAATALEHLAVIECSWDWDDTVHGWGLAGRLLEPLQRCSSLRALELQIPDCLDLASLSQLTHFHWTDRDRAESGFGTSDLSLGSSLASLTLQPSEWVFEDEDAASLARLLTGNSTIRSLEMRVYEVQLELKAAMCSMTGVTRFVTEWCKPFYMNPAGMLAQTISTNFDRLTELRLISVFADNLMLPPTLTSLALHFSAYESQRSLQTFANVGRCRALRRLSLAGVVVELIQDHVLTCLDCDDSELLDKERAPRPSNSLLCDLRSWAAHVDVPALAVQFFRCYVVSPSSELTELELLIHDFPSEADRAELQAAAACPISWVCEPTALTQDIVGVPERFRRRVRRAA